MHGIPVPYLVSMALSSLTSPKKIIFSLDTFPQPRSPTALKSDSFSEVFVFKAAKLTAGSWVLIAASHPCGDGCPLPGCSSAQEVHFHQKKAAFPSLSLCSHPGKPSFLPGISSSHPILLIALLSASSLCCFLRPGALLLHFPWKK